MCPWHATSPQDMGWTVDLPWPSLNFWTTLWMRSEKVLMSTKYFLKHIFISLRTRKTVCVCHNRSVFDPCFFVPPQPPPKLPLGVFTNDFQDFVTKWWALAKTFLNWPTNQKSATLIWFYAQMKSLHFYTCLLVYLMSCDKKTAVGVNRNAWVVFVEASLVRSVIVWNNKIELSPSSIVSHVSNIFGVICVCSLIKNPAERADLKKLMVGTHT